MRILALDAALQRCSAALLEDGALLGQHHDPDARAAATALPAMADALLAAHGRGLDGVAVSTGPGSFTGLRAAIAFAHGVALGRGIPLLGLSVPEVLRAAAPGPAWVALDPRRPGRVFLCRGEGAESLALDALPLPGGPVIVIGDAADQVAEAVGRAGGQARAAPPAELDAALLGRLAAAHLAAGHVPGPVRPLYPDSPAARPQPSRPAPA